jgi:putative lipoprotein
MHTHHPIEPHAAAGRVTRRPALVAACTLAFALALLVVACRDTARGSGGLENVHWRLAEAGGRAAIADSSAREAYIMFNPADSSAAGHSGCNRFGGRYVRTGDQLTITRVISTKMACLATGAMEQEAALFTALQATVSWKRGGDTLELLDANGAVVARFSAVAQ